MTKKTDKEEPTLAFIDRIEGSIAVLILSDETQLNVALNQLPDAVKEGDYLQVTFDSETGQATDFAPDEETTAAAQTRVVELQTELSPDDDAAPMNIQL